MARFAVLESNSGFVWGVVDADCPLAACSAVDEDAGCHHDEAGIYETVSLGELRTTRGGIYDVRSAPEGFDVQDGQDRSAIDAVEALPRAGVFGWVSFGVHVKNGVYVL